MPAYLLYDKPKWCARTGHVAVVVTESSDDANSPNFEKISYFFSMYHGIKPSEMHDASLLRKMSVFPAYCVELLLVDQRMRGQSWMRAQSKEKEDIAVPDLIATLSEEAMTAKAFEKAGAYQYCVKMPIEISDHLCKEKAMAIARGKIPFVVFSPFLSLFDLNEKYNCSSAVLAIVDHANRAKNPRVSDIKKVGWMLYAAFLSMHFFEYPIASVKDKDMGVNENILILLPCAYVCYNALLYARDLTAMGARKTPPYVYALIFIMGIAINLVGMLFGQGNAVENVFAFPGMVFRKLRTMPGAKVYEWDAEKETYQSALSA